MPEKPLVSIICLCYNHERFVEEAVRSAIDQTYRPLEVIIVDDCSTDCSRMIITELAGKYPHVKFCFPAKNSGPTRAFNEGYKLAKGDYLIDLATDDVLMPRRVEEGVRALEALGDDYGVNFCNASVIDERDKFLSFFYPTGTHGGALVKPKEGDVFIDLLRTHFISAPAMLIRRSVFEALNGYDGSLAYEDFDFWIRSSRIYQYCYTDKVLIKRRKVKGSLSDRQYAATGGQMVSTMNVLRKAVSMVYTRQEKQALKYRIYLEMRQCIKYMRVRLFFKYMQLLLRIARHPGNKRS